MIIVFAKRLKINRGGEERVPSRWKVKPLCRAWEPDLLGQVGQVSRRDLRFYLRFDAQK
jgi:hypothetical protein